MLVSPTRMFEGELPQGGSLFTYQRAYKLFAFTVGCLLPSWKYEYGIVCQPTYIGGVYDLGTRT